MEHSDIEMLSSSASKALDLAAKFSYGCMRDDGHWCGEVLDNTTVTSEYIFLRISLGHDFNTDPDASALRQWLLSQQNPDGSWGIAPGYPGDASTTVETYFALKILQVSTDDPAMVSGRLFALKVGGTASARLLTRFILATFGLMPWSAIPQLPPEFFLVPSYFRFNVYNLSCWSRITSIPMLVIRHHEPVYALPNGAGADFLDELWLEPLKKNVPYCPSLWESLWKADVITFAFTALDKMVSLAGGLRCSPTRGYALQQCVKWILEHQEAEGDWTGIFPPIYTSILALREEGWSVSDSVITRGLEGLERLVIKDAKGKRIQSSISPVWDTVLMTVGLVDAEFADERLDTTVQWIKKKQHFGPNGDWRIYNPALPPGGWSFQYYNTWYPDTDDTAVAILALVKKDPKSAGSFSIHRAAQWILGMQNRDGGWGAFDMENNKLFLNKTPLGDMNNLCDPSTADVTGRILECFALLLSSPHSKQVSAELLARMEVAARNGIAFLENAQEKTGAWYGRWGSNYIYGTSNVLCGLPYYMDKPRVRSMATRGLDWMKSVQNSDGGWGESLETYSYPELAGMGPSTATQTAWTVMALLAHLPPTDCYIKRGVSYLVSLQSTPDGSGASWPQPWYTAVGFPLFMWMEYALYRHYFPMMALGRFVRETRNLNVEQKV